MDVVLVERRTARGERIQMARFRFQEGQECAGRLDAVFERPDPFPVSVPVLMRGVGTNPLGVSEGGA